MRKFVLPVLLMALFAGCKEKNTGGLFTVSGTLKNSPAKVVYAEESIISTGERKLKDSATIGADGKFSMKVQAAEQGIYNLRLQNEVPPFVTIINDAGKIDITADFNKQYDFYNVSGSKASKTIQEYLTKVSELQRNKFDLLMKADSIRKNNGDQALADNYDQQQKDIASQLKTHTQQILQQSDKAPLSLFILATYQGMANNPNYRLNGFTAEELMGLLNEMLNKFPGRQDIAGIRNSIESQMKAEAQASRPVWVGKQAPEISLPDTEGRPVKLSSFRGKYVLVDFWASWCGPCRRENPNVVDAYNKFKSKNFTILGVSLDRPGQKDAWMKAIVDDNLNWTHVSDLKFWQSEVVPIYQVSSIPFNVLVDPNGIVVAENLRGSALEQKLHEVLN